jgi:hypothetical protein
MMSASVCVICSGARIDDAGGHAFGDAKTLLDLAQNQHASVRRQQPAVELGDDLLGPDR